MMANWNLLLGEIDTEYAVLLSADDWWEPRFLERMVAILDRHPESLLAAAAVRVMESDRQVEVLGLHQLWPADRGACPPAEALRLLLTRRNRLYVHAVLARAELYRRVRLEDSPVADWMLFDRLLCPPLNAFRRELGLPPVKRVLQGWWNSPRRVIGLLAAGPGLQMHDGILDDVRAFTQDTPQADDITLSVAKRL